MSLRAAALAKGKVGDVQRFSQSRAPEPAIARLVKETMIPDTDPVRRAQILSDPTNVYQFACVWDNQVGFLTRPVVTTEGDETFVTGSFSDKIGHSLPVKVPLASFQSFLILLIIKI